jgi:tetratricopeptide (TPR) repeat protein
MFQRSSAIDGHALFWPNYDLGVVYYKNGDWAQAAGHLFQAVSANPRLTVIMMQDSMVYRQMFGSPYFRFSLKDEVIEAQSRAFVLLLSSLLHAGQYEKMFIVSQLALSNPDLSYKDAFYFYAGMAFYMKGQLDKALLLFDKSLSIEKNNPDVYYYIAAIDQRAGQSQQAKAFLQLSYALHLKNDGRFPYEEHFNVQAF